MDTIWNAAFGVDIDIQNNKQENFYFTQCEQLFADLSNFGFVHYFSSKTPYVANNLQYSRKHEINSFFLKKAYIHEIKDYVIPTLILMAKVSNRTANPFIWMANSIGEIVEKQKNEKVTYQFRKESSISNPKGSCKIHSWSNLAKFKYKILLNLAKSC